MKYTKQKQRKMNDKMVWNRLSVTCVRLSLLPHDQCVSERMTLIGHNFRFQWTNGAQWRRKPYKISTQSIHVISTIVRQNAVYILLCISHWIGSRSHFHRSQIKMTKPITYPIHIYVRICIFSSWITKIDRWAFRRKTKSIRFVSKRWQNGYRVNRSMSLNLYYVKSHTSSHTFEKKNELQKASISYSIQSETNRFNSMRSHTFQTAQNHFRFSGQWKIAKF